MSEVPHTGNSNRQSQKSASGNARKKNRKQFNSPLISIITITFNAEKVIEPTMKSVEQQTFRNFEHLIIDGGSSDSTIAKARLIGGRKLRVLSEQDEGLYDAMNKGLRLARGKYVIFLNAGDAFHSSETLAQYAAADSLNPDIVYGDTVIVNNNRSFLRRRHLDAPSILTARSYLRGMLICHQAMMVRSRIAPYYDLQYRFSADYDWSIRVIKASRPGARINLKSVTIDYLDDGLTEKNKIKSLRERFRIMANHFGVASTIMAHLSFIPRAVKRRLGFHSTK